MTVKPTPFTLRVPDADIADLRDRLARARFPDQAPGDPWAYGTDVAYLRELTGYWCDHFDWRAAEAALNAFPQFRVPLDGVDLHYLHVPGVGPDPMPLLLLHGWPGSVFEFLEFIPRPTDPARFGGDARDAFTVVAPSLPGYGLSFQPGQRRFGVAEIADCVAALMHDVLGYQSFGAQGGDWGAAVSSRLGYAHADRMIGIHINLMMAAGRDPSAFPDPTEEERRYLGALAHWTREETGYQWIQGTRPQTLAFGLTDSPAGLAAWIVEKYRAWSDCGGDVESVFSKDELLINITIYWATGTIASSFRPYWDFRHNPNALPWMPVKVPCGIAIFPKDIETPPREFAERTYNVQHWTEMPRGGHFPGLEQPGLLADDIRTFFRLVR